MALPLIDGLSAVIVFGGTLLATLLRCGWRECGLAGRAVLAAFGPGYRAAAGRAGLVEQVRAIRAEGVLRAAPPVPGDAEFAAATAALLHDRSLPALLAAHQRHRLHRLAEAETAVRVLAQASELAPVFGMAGTLVALSRMPSTPLADGAAITGAVGLAVVTTLYGILAANLLLAPLARLVERVAKAEECARQEVLDWLARQVEDAVPARRERGRAAA